jgi:hypothetical protein
MTTREETDLLDLPEATLAMVAWRRVITEVFFAAVITSPGETHQAASHHPRTTENSSRHAHEACLAALERPLKFL